MININLLVKRLVELGYDQDMANRLCVKHFSCGTIDEFLADIERQEGTRSGV